MSYLALNAASVAELEAKLSLPDYDGFNITMPFKREVLSFASSMSEEVKALCSANTLVRDGASFKAFSTDGEGLVASLKYRGVDLRGASVYLYGLGGASRPIAYALIRAGASKLYYESRRRESEEDFRLLLGGALGAGALRMEPARGLSRLSCDIAINASSYGSRPEPRPSIDTYRIDAGLYYDIIYGRETELLREARERNRQVVGGLDMLIAQALLAFQHFYPGLGLSEGLFYELKEYMEA